MTGLSFHDVLQDRIMAEVRSVRLLPKQKQD